MIDHPTVRYMNLTYFVHLEAHLNILFSIDSLKLHEVILPIDSKLA